MDKNQSISWFVSALCTKTRDGDTILSQARFRYTSHRSGTKLEGEKDFALTSLSAGVLTVPCE